MMSLLCAFVLLGTAMAGPVDGCFVTRKKCKKISESIECYEVEEGCWAPPGVIDECGVPFGDGIPVEACNCAGDVFDECGECGGNGGQCSRLIHPFCDEKCPYGICDSYLDADKEECKKCDKCHNKIGPPVPSCTPDVFQSLMESPLMTQQCANVLFAAVVGTSDDTVLTFEECECIGLFNRKTFKAATGVDARSCGVGADDAMVDSMDFTRKFCIRAYGSGCKDPEAINYEPDVAVHVKKWCVKRDPVCERVKESRMGKKELCYDCRFAFVQKNLNCMEDLKIARRQKKCNNRFKRCESKGFLDLK